MLLTRSSNEGYTMKTGVRIVAAIVVSLGITVALAAMQTHRTFGHGAFCSRLTEDHVDAHAEHLRSWASMELALTDQQAAALEPVIGSLENWASDMAPICANGRSNAPDMVAAAVELTEVTQRSVARFATAFDELYATLNDDQRRTVDGWFTHEDGHRGFHERAE
jgi:hypothetical protein